MIPLIALVHAALLQPEPPNISAPPEQPLECNVGPLAKTYGGHPWIVYSCADGQTLVVAAGEGNPAQPFYFIIFPKDGAYDLYGEGTGAREATSAAFEELRRLGPEQIAALIRDVHGAQTTGH